MHTHMHMPMPMHMHMHCARMDIADAVARLHMLLDEGDRAADVPLLGRGVVGPG